MEIKIPKTFQQTNPRWTKKIQNRETIGELQEVCMIDNKELNIRKFNCCIVGETLNLFDKGHMYGLEEEQLIAIHKGCKKCLEFSRRFDSVIAEYNLKGLEKKLKEFSKHIEKKHRELLND